MSTTKLNRFTAGINNVEPETDLPKGSLRSAINVDMTNKGRIRRRPGYVLRYSGSGIHSYWNRYFVENGTLKLLNPDYTASSIVSGLSSKRLSYCDVNGIIHFSNEDDNGTVNGPWGVDDITRVPEIEIISGGFKGGRYQISVANISSTGELGGATNPIIVTLQDNEGIRLNNIYQDGYDLVIYISTPNGKELYQQTVLSSGNSTIDIITLNDEGDEAETLFMKKIVPGHIIRHFKGRIFVADGSVLWYTAPQRYGLYNPSSNYFQFPERITVVQETENGIFIVSDKIYFLPGTNPEDMTLTIVGDSTGFEGTGITADADDFNLEFNGKIAYWYGSKGAILGFPDGTIKYVSEDRHALDLITGGAGVTGFREYNGIRQMITNLFEQNSNDSAFSASDNVIAQVVRNGVVIP